VRERTLKIARDGKGECVCVGGGDGSRCGSAQGGRDIEDDSVTI